MNKLSTSNKEAAVIPHVYMARGKGNQEGIYVDWLLSFFMGSFIGHLWQVSQHQVELRKLGKKNSRVLAL
jgi:hypothetical protein